MRPNGFFEKVPWREVSLTSAMLAGLLALPWAAAETFGTPWGHYSALLVELMRSRVVLYNPGVTGYYERLFGASNPMFMKEKEYEAWSKESPDLIYDHRFRIRRFKPNLHAMVHRAQPQGLTTNGYGFLGPDVALTKPPGTRRIAFFGDSITQGWGTDQKKSFVSLLENELNSTRPAGASVSYQVLNFAVTGYNLTQALDTAEMDAPRFSPDLYVLSLTEMSVFRAWDEHLVRVIQLGIDPKYEFLRDVIRESGASKEDGPMVLMGKLAPFRERVLRKCILAMKARATEDRVPLLAVLAPAIEDGDMYQRRLEEIPEMLASLGILVVNLGDTFEKVQDLDAFRINPFDVHPNAKGHALIFQNLYEKLRGRQDLWEAVSGIESGKVAVAR